MKFIIKNTYPLVDTETQKDRYLVKGDVFQHVHPLRSKGDITFRSLSNDFLLTTTRETLEHLERFDYIIFLER